MCDQYYGCNAKPGGGLFVLEHPFGDSPQLINLLENSVVENGPTPRPETRRRHASSRPEVSFDGKTILFAYSEAKACAKSKGKETYLWRPEYSLPHLPSATADGTGWCS